MRDLEHRERVREEVEWTGERAEVDMEETGYITILTDSVVDLDHWTIT